jgi:hypothetical protein
MGTRSFPGVKWPGRGVENPPPSSALLPLWAFMVCYRANFTFTPRQVFAVGVDFDMIDQIPITYSAFVNTREII